MDGIINVYKEANMTSFDVVRKIKKIANTKKVGHGGTLDPLARGVLPVFLGNTTKFLEYALNDRKVYRAELLLGKASDTYDIEGKILSEREVKVKDEDLLEILNSFLGDIYQVPPMYSALKKDGKKLYELAREGIEVEREKRHINIKSITDIVITVPYMTFTVDCSKGTYIRSLCHDIGEKAGCGAILTSLERVATGLFSKENSVSINDIDEENIKDHIIKIEDIFTQYEKIRVNEKFEKLLINGVCVNNHGFVENIKSEKLYAVFNEDNCFVGIGKMMNSGFKLTKTMVRS